ncbi:hypothetical protein C2F69_RS12515 [Vibrio parahaemolyticus]|nr:hypothetical protein [Vibrio parahaemolyticus]
MKIKPLSVSLLALVVSGCSKHMFVPCNSTPESFVHHYNKEIPVYTEVGLDKQKEMLTKHAEYVRRDLNRQFVPQCHSKIDDASEMWLSAVIQRVEKNQRSLNSDIKSALPLNEDVFDEVSTQIPDQFDYVDEAGYGEALRQHFEQKHNRLYRYPATITLSKFDWVSTSEGQGHFAPKIEPTVLHYKITESSKYVGSNAYGVERVINKTVGNSKQVVYWNHFDHKEPTINLPTMTTSKANQMLGKKINLDLFFRFKPYSYANPRFLNFTRHEIFEPTIEAPSDIRTEIHQLYAEVVAATYNAEYVYYSVW